MSNLKNVSIDDIGYTLVINIGYRLGTKEQIKDFVKSSISHLESISPLSKSSLRSIHLIPLSQISDVTAELTAAAI